MWTVAKIRADYEGWWLFSDWPEQIIKQYDFENYDDMLSYYRNLIIKSKKDYDNYLVGKYNIHAFYNNCELGFCEDCDEDLQIFYSYIVLNDNEIFYDLPIVE
ncbi:regulatory protein MsaA [Staphylococcus caeli]|uniref:regulatory protein MsaA n=1 Tax=Staphylococcus caeli TaxID=2201815 RepID=UPI003F577FA3